VLNRISPKKDGEQQRTRAKDAAGLRIPGAPVAKPRPEFHIATHQLLRPPGVRAGLAGAWSATTVSQHGQRGDNCSPKPRTGFAPSNDRNRASSRTAPAPRRAPPSTPDRDPACNLLAETRASAVSCTSSNPVTQEAPPSPRPRNGRSVPAACSQQSINPPPGPTDRSVSPVPPNPQSLLALSGAPTP